MQDVTANAVALQGGLEASGHVELTGIYFVGPQRLSPFGSGPYAPVATNATEEGRAKNRRVELVAR